MTALFLFLMPALAGIAMALWLRHARQVGGRHWVLHWLAALAPVGLLLAILPVVPFAQVPDTLFILPLTGATAFAGGGLYLVIGTLAASASVQAAGATALESFREAVNSPGATDDSEHRDDYDHRNFAGDLHRRHVDLYGDHAYYDDFDDDK